MNETVTLTKASFVKLLDTVLYPNPDDPGDPRNPWGPYGPIGPVAQALRDLSWVLLNPQPLPPVAGPSPLPWRSAFLARTVIDQAVAQYRSAEMLSAEQSARALEAVRSYIREFVDDYCGTRPPKWPRPWPWPPKLDSVQPHPVDLLVAGAQFQKAADFDNPLRTDFSSAADQLFETGLRQMENR
jgi:hypothetical protein